jgi:hypothetical protein
MSKQVRKAVGCVVDQLESRTMMSVYTYADQTVGIYGTSGNDVINITVADNQVRVSDNGVNHLFNLSQVKALEIFAGDGHDLVEIQTSLNKVADIYGGTGNDTLRGGLGADRIWGDDGDDLINGRGGNDQLWSGNGSDEVHGGNNDDVLVTIAGGTDTLFGESGIDSFWRNAADSLVDASDTEISRRNTHTVSGFSNGVTTAVSPGNLPDPSDIGSRTSVRYRSLFSSAGPRLEDIDQGMINDCWLLAGLGAMAQNDPNSIRQSVVDMGDGTYAVRFTTSGSTRYVRVDHEVRADAAQFTAGGSAWVQVMEKAFAVDRGSYAALNWDHPKAAWNNLGLSTRIFLKPTRALLLDFVQSEWQAGRSITVGTSSTTSLLVKSHIYNVVGWSVTRDWAGTVIGGYLKVRNPHGVDGPGSTDSNKSDGVFTVNWSDLGNFIEAMTIKVG